jgi:hypothetical protein
LIISSVYSIGSADRDGNELQDIRREEDLRQGRISNETNSEHQRIGTFEKHTKVILFLKSSSVFSIKFIGYRTTSIRASWMA